MGMRRRRRESVPSGPRASRGPCAPDGRIRGRAGLSAADAGDAFQVAHALVEVPLAAAWQADDLESRVHALLDAAEGRELPGRWLVLGALALWLGALLGAPGVHAAAERLLAVLAA